MSTSLIVGLALAVAAPGPKDAAKPPPKLEGEWVLERFDGPKDAPPGAVTMKFTDNRITIVEGGVPGGRDRNEEADYTVDLTKKPAHIDIRPTRGKQDMVVLGLFAIEGDTLKLCFGFGGGQERPAELKADTEKGVALITLKRVKADKAGK